MDVTAVLIVAIVFGTIFGLFFIFVRRRERLTMIERGYDPSLFVKERPSSRFTSLKYGMLLIGLGVGILSGNILVALFAMKEEVAFFAMTFLFGGTALVLNYLIESRERKMMK